MTSRLPLFAGLLVGSAAITPSLAAQGVIHQWVGDTRYQFHGHVVSDAGDVNGDGFADVLVGAPGDDGFGQSSGLARLYSGADGSQLREWNGTAGQDELGHCVSGAGDVNGDGTPDIIICAPRADPNGLLGSGQVKVYSGSNFSLLYTLDGGAAKDFFGWSATDLGDCNFDGFDDFAVGGWQYDPGINPGTGIGYVRVYSGRDGSILHNFTGAHGTAYLGHSVAGPGDVNGDGAADILVGSHGEDVTAKNAGRVYLYSGADGSVIYTFDGDAQGDNLGFSVHAAGDVNNDGVPDMIAGAHQADPNGSNSGMARVYSGADGSILYTFNGDAADDLFGMSVGGGQDINADGHDDLVVGIRHDDSFGDNSGAVRAFSGATGQELWTAYGFAQDDLMGHSVSMAPDINGDGNPDVIIGGTQYNNGPGPGNGLVQALDPTQAPPPPPLQYPNLPASFLAIGAGLSEGFEVHAGSPPSHMAINELDAVSRDPSADAWCNIGQNGACVGGNSGIGPRTGSYDLEMGGIPGFGGSTTLANGLVIGLNGGGSSSYELSFWVNNLGEEPDNDDGVWLSTDGIDWEQVSGGWSGRPQNTWAQVTGVDLSSTSVDITGDFYLLFAQTDNFGLGDGDGLLIDDIEIMPVSSGYQITMVTPGTAGAINTVELEGATPGEETYFVYSSRLGSTLIPGCGNMVVDLLRPNILPPVIADGTGHCELSSSVPPWVSGLTVYLQAVEPTTCQVAPLYTQVF